MIAIQKWKKKSDFSGWSPMANWYYYGHELGFP